MRARAGAARDLRAADAAGADDLRRRLRRPAARRLLDRDRQPGAAAARRGRRRRHAAGAVPVPDRAAVADRPVLAPPCARARCRPAPWRRRRDASVARPRRVRPGGRLRPGACTLGPRLPAARPAQGPSPILPDQPTGIRRRRASTAARRSASCDGLDIPGQWWGVFQSPQLNSLIETALRANPDIQAASAGLRVAQENARAQRATLFPTVQAGFGASAEPDAGPCLSAPTADNNYDLRPVHARPDAQLQPRPVGRQPPADRIARGAGRGAVLPARGRLSVARLQRRGRGDPRSLAARPDRGDAAHHRRPARHARHPEPPVGPGRGHRRRRRRPAGRARPGRGDPAAAAEGAGAAAQPARHPDRPAARPVAGRALQARRPASCRRSCRSACRRSWSSSGPTCARPRPISIRPSALVGVAIANQFPNITLNAGINTQSLTLGTLFGPGARRLGRRRQRAADHPRRRRAGGQEAGGAGGAGAGRRAVPLDRAAPPSATSPTPCARWSTTRSR